MNRGRKIGWWQGDFTENSNTSHRTLGLKSYKSHPIPIKLHSVHPGLFPTVPKAHTNCPDTFSFNTIEIFNDKIVHYSITCVPTLQNRPLYTSTRWELFNGKKRDRWNAPWYQGCHEAHPSSSQNTPKNKIALGLSTKYKNNLWCFARKCLHFVLGRLWTMESSIPAHCIG